MAFLKKVKSTAKKAAKLQDKAQKVIAKTGGVVSKVAKNPAVRVAATGAVMMVAPAAAKDVGPTLDTAAKLGDAAKSLDPKRANAARAIIQNTVNAAAKGNPEAKRAVAVLSTVQKAKKGDPKAVQQVKALATVGKKATQPQGKVLKRFELLDTGRMREV